MEVVSFKLAALRKPFEARDDLTLTMKIARASQRQKTGAEKPGITGSGSRVFWAKKNTEVKDAPNELPKDTPADVACAVLGLLNKESCKDLEDYFET